MYPDPVQLVILPCNIVGSAVHFLGTHVGNDVQPAKFELVDGARQIALDLPLRVKPISHLKVH